MAEKLRVAVIGVSKSMGETHVKGVLKCSDAEIAAICDLDQDKLNDVGDRYGIPKEKRYTDWHELLKLGLDAVVVVIPDQQHRELCEAFLSAGCHVLCEKPLALKREDLEAIVHASDHSDRKFMVGQIARFTPSFCKAKELVDTGVIGELFYVESEYAHDYALLMDGCQKWRLDPLRHGVIGGGCHAVDLLRWIAGDPEEVFAYGNHKLLPQVTYDDATIAVLKFPNGVIGKIFVSTGCKRPYSMRTLFYGTKGTIICDNKSDHMELYTIGENGVSVNPVPEVIPVGVASHNTKDEFAIFAEHIIHDTPVLLDARQGAKTIAACLAIVQSSMEDRPIKPNYQF